MNNHEMFIEKTFGENIRGNKFPIDWFYSAGGYIWNNETVKCRTCGQTATYRVQISNHLYEPLGSEYYCGDCVPEDHAPRHD